MSYLDGEQIRIDTPTMKSMVGERVCYLLEWDIDKSGRGYYRPKRGTIAEVYNRQIRFNDDDWYPFSSIREMVEDNPNP